MLKARLLQPISGTLSERRSAVQTRSRAFWALALCFILAQSSTSGLLAADLPRVPPGFTITRVTTPEQVQHPIMACFDDRGRLYVCESAGLNAKAADLLKNPQDKIVRLEDTDGDGSFDKSITFADKLVFPQGVLWHEGVVYTCSSPYLWKLEDTDNDGVCDKRTILVKSFGFSGNAADIHGPFLGPEGRLWWCDGRHGHEIRTDDKGLAGGPDNAVDIPPKPEPGLPNPDGNLLSKGKAARIFNCKLDGSDVQTFCGGGMDNPVEIDFWDTGEVIGTVNLFHGTPRGDCLVHWVWGGVYPRTDQQACLDEFPRTVGPLDEIINYGHVAVSGMCKYRGDQFGKDWDQSVFITLFNTHKVIRTTLERSGSTFKATATEDFVVFDYPDSHPTDVLEDADGSLLVVDTGGWFRIGCPASQVAKPQIGGAIYRIKKNGAHRVEDPYGARLEASKATLKELLQSLRQGGPAIQAKAVAELRKRSPNGWRGETAKEEAELLRGLAASGVITLGDYYKLARDGRSYEREDLEKAPLHERWQYITASSQWFLKDRLTEVGPFSRGLIPVGFLAVLSSLPTDRMLEHTVIDGIRRCGGGDPGLLRDILQAADVAKEMPRVAKAALVVLDSAPIEALQRDSVIPLLATSDIDLQTTVFDVISRHEGWAAGVVDLIGQWLNQSPIPQDRRAIVRRFLAARANEPAVQKLVADQMNRKSLPDDVRQTLLSVMAEASINEIPTEWIAALRESLKLDQNTQKLAVEVAFRHRVPQLRGDLNSLIAGDRPKSEGSQPYTDAQLEAIEILHARDRLPMSDQRFWCVSLLVNKSSDPIRQATAARILADSQLAPDQLSALIPLIDPEHAVVAPTLLRAFEGCTDVEVGIKLVRQLMNEAREMPLPAADLSRAFKTFPEHVQQFSRSIIRDRGFDPAKQAVRLAELTEATKTGNAKAGREVFFSNKALCSRCHRVNGQGETIGPDLSMVGAIRQHHELVEAVVEPSYSFVRSYRPVTLATADGRVHTGVIASETSTEITLRTADFNEVRISRADVESFKESDTSIMPAGVDQRLTRTELADLIAYLVSLKERKP